MVGIVWVPVPGGESIRKPVYAKTEKAAIKALDKFKATVTSGVLPDNATLGQWCDHWLNLIAPGELTADAEDGRQ